MTKEEAVDLIAKEGLVVVGTKVFPHELCKDILEWAGVMVEAVKKNPSLVNEMTTEKVLEMAQRLHLRSVRN